MAQCNYEELKNQIEFETKTLIENINHRYEDEYGIKMPKNLTLVDFVGDYGYIDMYDRGCLFAYLSIKSFIEKLES